MGSVGLGFGGSQSLAVLCSSALVAMFTVSSVAKASDVAAFVRTLRALVPGVGADRARVAGLCVIGIEGAVALWLASGMAHKAAALAALAGTELPREHLPLFAIQVLAAIGCVIALDLRRMAPRFLPPPAPPGAPGIEWLDKGARS